MAKGAKKSGAKAAAASSSASSAAVDEDDYGDDFEDYEDEDACEEQTEVQAWAPPKTSTTEPHPLGTKSSSKKKPPPAAQLAVDVDALQESMKLENATTAQRLRSVGELQAKAEAKPQPRAESKATARKATAASKSSRLRTALARADPRVARAKRLREALSLKSERFVCFESPSSSRHQWYLLQLARGSCEAAEKACVMPETREAAGQTASTDIRDASTQFSLGLDESDESKATLAPVASRLEEFVACAGELVDSILEDRSRPVVDLFDDWRRVAALDAPVDRLEFGGRTLLALLFYEDEFDTNADRVLITVADARWSDAKRKLHAYRGPGRATAARVVSRKLVVAGTAAGLVLCWRISDEYPCYTSSCLALTAAAHVGPVKAVDATDVEAVSVDESGLVCVWRIASESALCGEDEEDEEPDDPSELGAMPGASVRLRLVRAFNVFSRIPAAIFGKEEPLVSLAESLVDVDAPSDVGLGQVALLPAVLTAAVARCDVKDLDLFVAVKSFVARCRDSVETDVYFLETPTPDCDALEFVTVVAPHPILQELVLVGQLDGVVRVHLVANPRPLVVLQPPEAQSTTAADAKDNDEEPNFVSVVGLEWSPQRPAVFFALYSTAAIATFDLLASDEAPTTTCFLSKHLDVPIPRSRPAMALAAGRAAVAVDNVIFVSRLPKAPSATDELAGLRAACELDDPPLFDATRKD